MGQHPCILPQGKDSRNVFVCCWTVGLLSVRQQAAIGKLSWDQKEQFFAICDRLYETDGDTNCSFPGSTPLHLAARSGSLDCVRELLAWGADRLQRDSSG